MSSVPTSVSFCNAQYQQLFQLSDGLRIQEAHLPSVVVASVELGEQPNVTPDTLNAWIASFMDPVKSGGDEQTQLFDGTWLRIRSQPGQNVTSTIVASDITRLKHAEAELLTANDRLKILAATDGLTRLLNRRSLDDRLEREVSWTKRARQPVSLIMIDIDRFKAFNVIYGHPAGDECTQPVASTIALEAKRPGDLVARYGGEELCVVLSDTDEGGAFVLAEKMRLSNGFAQDLNASCTARC